MREKILTRIADLAARRAGRMFALALVITVIAAGLASRLKLEMQFKNLMPQDHPMVQEFNQILDDYHTASMIIIAAKGAEQELKPFADELVPEIRAMKDDIRRVDYTMEREFILEHGLMLQKADDLENMKGMYEDLSLLPLLTHLNDSFEKEYVQDEESISTNEKENNAVRFLDGIKHWLNAIERYAANGATLDPAVAEASVDQFLIGDEYFISQDKDMLLIFAQPAFAITDMERVVEVVNAVDERIARVAERYPGVFAGTTGTFALTRDEMEAGSEDMFVTSIIAFVLILLLFIVSFRMWTAPLLAGISLTMGILWAAGFAALTVGSLNIMTSMFSVLLLGLGIDFSIHMISVYTECRGAGCSIGDALHQTLLKSGNGIITGSLTTACAFLTLMISDSAGMSEFGLVAGSGVIFCMLSTLLALPAMLSLRDKIWIRFRREKYSARSVEFHFLGRLAHVISRRPVSVLLGCLVITAVLLFSALKITFDYNYLNMEPVGLTSIKLQDEMIEEFDVTPDFALITASSVEDARRIADAAKDLKMVGMVTSISNYIPSVEEQQKRIPHLQEIRSDLTTHHRLTPLTEENFEPFLAELNRVETNVIELAQLAYLGGQNKVDQKSKEIIGDLEDPQSKSMIAVLIDKLNMDRPKSIRNLNLFQEHYAPYFRQLALGMASTEPITLEDLPRNIWDQFVDKKGNRFLVSIYPKEQVWNLEFLKRFTHQMQELDPRVTGMPPVFYVLIQIIGRDGKVAAGLTVIVVFLLVFLDFRDIRSALMAMVPLVVGAIWMVGAMHLLGLQLTLVNVMAIPLIIGIGIDDGVHILHRYRIEGAGKISTVLTSTGKSVLLTSLTTMLAFGSLKFATYRGLGSLGMALFIGVGMCFLTSVVILPALLGWMEKTGKQERSV